MSELDSEGVIFDVVETMPSVEGFGQWQQTSIEEFGEAKARGLASAYIEITTPSGDDAMLHLVARPLPVAPPVFENGAS